MTQTHAVSLRDIPKHIFFEFRDKSKVGEIDTHKPSIGSKSVISICLAQESGENGPMTLALEELICPYGRNHRTNLYVFGFRACSKHVRMDSPNPLLTIFSRADDPPYENLSTRRWEKGKGYWVLEELLVAYGGFNRPFTITSRFKEWEFEFLLKLQTRALELVHDVAIRGHWQREWGNTHFLENKVKEED